MKNRNSYIVSRAFHPPSLLLSVVFLFSISICHSQSDVIKYARSVVESLASPFMHGRGYVNKGDSLAADYIKKEFEKLEIQPVGKDFYQKFYFPVNTFPDKTDLKINYGIREDILTPGKDFLVRSGSPSFNGYAHRTLKAMDVEKIILFGEKEMSSEKRYKKSRKSKYYNSILLINACTIKDKKKYAAAESWIINNSKSELIITFKPDKQNWSVSQEQSHMPVVECTCKDSSIINNIQEIRYDVRSKHIPNYPAKNVIGYIKGTQHPDSFIVFSAHYDHLGRMGKDAYFPGANDNASGCAMLLNLAKYYSQHPPKYSVAFIAFGGEEAGLVGSKYYVEHPLFPLKQIKFLINMDIMGTGDEGIKVVNATENAKEFDQLVKINEEKKLLPSVQPRGKAANSDHYFFSEAGVKSIFIYTLGGIKAYHDIYDRPETLPLTKFEETYNLLLQFSDFLQR